MGASRDFLSKAWGQELACGGLAIAVLLAFEVSAPLVAVLALAAALGLALLRGGRIFRRALDVADARDQRRSEKAAALRGQTVARVHDWLRPVQDELEAFVARSEGDPGTIAGAEAASELLEELHDTLDDSRVSREEFRGARIPLVGGDAEAISKRLGGALKRYAWTPLHLMPGSLRGAADQTSMVLDEIRVLHNAEIERSVLLLTLVARATLVLLAPLLGAWTSADTPVAHTGPIADLVWLAAAVVSVGTVFIGPRLVDTAMTESDGARAFRRRLLWIEVPIALAVLVFQPAWTVVVFVTGWTNWWQRQTPELAFDWRKLAIFVGAVIILQGVGLSLQSVAVAPAVLEIAVALAAIAITGGSYGAMLPLTVATMFAVIVGDSRRSISAARAARMSLIDCSDQLFRTAAAIDVAAHDMPLAHRAASMARSGAENLEREADFFGRRGIMARQVLVDLVDQAIARSILQAGDSNEYKLVAAAAKANREPDPPYAMTPTFGALGRARIPKRGNANDLLRFLVAALNEAGAHGIDGVRVFGKVREGRLLVTVGNLPKKNEVSPSSEGGKLLRHYAAKLPGGRVTQPLGLREGSAVGINLPHLRWWVAEVECDVEVVDVPIE